MTLKTYPPVLFQTDQRKAARAVNLAAELFSGVQLAQPYQGGELAVCVRALAETIQASITAQRDISNQAIAALTRANELLAQALQERDNRQPTVIEVIQPEPVIRQARRLAADQERRTKVHNPYAPRPEAATCSPSRSAVTSGHSTAYHPPTKSLSASFDPNLLYG
jgi:hypothetical protein